MKEDILGNYLVYKTNILIDYSKTILQMLITEKLVRSENKKLYQNLTQEIITKYMQNFYFSNQDSLIIIEQMVKDSENPKVKNASIIASICVEFDKIYSPFEEFMVDNKKLKNTIQKLVNLLNINLDKVRNKNLYEELIEKLKKNHKNEVKFLASLPDDEDFVNFYEYNMTIANFYFVNYEFNLEEFKNIYPSILQKALKDADIISNLAFICISKVNTLILQELLTTKKASFFAINLPGSILRSNRHIKDLITLVNNYNENYIYLKIDYIDYINNKIKKLKNRGFKFIIDCNDFKEEEIEQNNIIYVAKEYLNPQLIDRLYQKNIKIIEKNKLSMITAEEVLKNNKGVEK